MGNPEQKIIHSTPQMSKDCAQNGEAGCLGRKIEISPGFNAALFLGWIEHNLYARCQTFTHAPFHAVSPTEDNIRALRGRFYIPNDTQLPCSEPALEALATED